MLDNRLKYRFVLLASLLFFGSCQTLHRMFQKDHRGESVTISSEGLDAYNDSVQQDRIQRFSDSCDRMLQGERNSMLRHLPPKPSWEIMADSIIDYAMEFMHVPYRHGGNGPTVFDCSGFTKYVFNRFGYQLKRSVVGQLHDGWRKIEDTSELRCGDLVFFGGRRNPTVMGHVAIVVDNDPEANHFTFIHATLKKGVIISASNEKYYRIRYMTACRILPD